MTRVQRSLLCGVLMGFTMPALGYAATYYVAAGGTNGSPGNSSRPWATIAFGAGKLAPGDILVVRPGIYRETVFVTRSGTAAKPITIRGLPGAVLESPDPNKSLSAFDFVAKVAYVRLQGFELRGGFAETVFLRAAAHDIELSSLTVHDNRTGIWVGGAYRVVIRDAVLRNNFRTGVRMYAGAHDVQIFNTRSEANDDGLGCDGMSDGFNADTGCDNILFDTVAAVGNSQDGFDMQASNVTLLRVTSANNQCAGIKASDSAYIENALVVGNTTGINVNGPVGAQTTIVYSTVLDNDLGVRAIGAGHSLAVTDSIVSGPGKALDYAVGVALVEGRNIFARPDLRERLIVQESASGQVLFSGDDINAGKWTQASGQGAGTVARDPGLDAATHVPVTGSPAIDSAGRLASVTVDHDGNPRPSGAGYDRGAFERQTSAGALRLRTARLHSAASGAGRARFRAEMWLPGSAPFDPLTDSLSVVVSGTHGTVGTLELGPGQLRVSPAGVGRAMIRTQDGAMLRLTLAKIGSGHVVLLHGYRVDTWRAPNGEITLDVTVGHQRAYATTTLRGVQGQFAMP